MLKILYRSLAFSLVLTAFFLILIHGASVVDWGVQRVLSRLGASLDTFIHVDTPSEAIRHAPVSLDSDSAPLLRIALLADSENDWKHLRRGLELAQDRRVDAVFFLGDLSSYGDIPSLKQGASILYSVSPIPVFVLPGDHDLAESVSAGDSTGHTNFLSIFPAPSQIYEKEGFSFLFLDNSSNYSPIPNEQFQWFLQNVADVDFVILSQPLFHPVNPRVMGVVDGNEVSTVRSQANALLDAIRKSSVMAVISADQHAFSTFPDPIKPELRHIVIGALVSNSEGLRNTQSPRFALLELYADGRYKILDFAL